MSDVLRSISVRCVDVLQTVEALRSMPLRAAGELSASCAGVGSSGVASKHLFEVAAHVLNILRSVSTLPEAQLQFFHKNDEHVTSALSMMLNLLENCRDHVPNHFGVHESRKFIPDIINCKIILSSIAKCASEYSEETENRTVYSLYQDILHGNLQHMSLNDFTECIQGVILDMPHLPSRVFWLKSFGLRNSISWDTFLKRFLDAYQQDHVELEGSSSGSERCETISCICSESIDRLKGVLHEIMPPTNNIDQSIDKCKKSTTENTTIESVDDIVKHTTSNLKCEDDAMELNEKHEIKSRNDNVCEDSNCGEIQESTTRDVNEVNISFPVLQTRGEETSEGASRGEDNVEKLCFKISRAGFATFCERLTAYDAFQCACDPSTVILCSGKVNSSANMVESSSSLLFPTVVGDLLGYKITQVACGGSHVAAVTSSGKLFTWGNNTFGQLGHGTTSDNAKPREVEEFSRLGVNCKKVACGFAFTGVISSTGSVYMWGVGENGRLGTGDERDRSVPVLVSKLKELNISDIQAGSVHTCFLTTSGSLYSCGKFEYNGHGLKADLLYPRPLLPVFFGVDMPGVCQVAVNFGGFHTIALTDNNEVFTWGQNRCGQLGYYSDNGQSMDESTVSPNGPLPKNFEGAFYSPTPRRVLLHNSSIAGKNALVSQVSAGWGHSAVLLKDGTLFACGRNESGQLGTGDRSKCCVNERGHKFKDHFALVVGDFEADEVKSMVCGLENSLLICGKNTVYGTGNNKSSQMGYEVNAACLEEFHNLKFNKHPLVKGRELLQASCGMTCSIYLWGNYVVPSLYSICKTCIGRSSELTSALELKDLCLAVKGTEHCENTEAKQLQND